MFSQVFVGFQSFCNKNTHFAHTAFQMRSHKRDEFVAWIWMHPYAILNSDKTCAIKQSSKLDPRAPAPLADIKNKHTPLPVPKSRLRYHIFSKFYFLYYRPPLLCNLYSTLCIFTSKCNQTVLF